MIVVLETDANALFAGIMSVNACRALSVASRPDVRSAEMNTESCGLLDAALIAFCVLMDLALPMPLAGNIPHCAPISPDATGAVVVGLAELVGLDEFVDVLGLVEVALGVGVVDAPATGGEPTGEELDGGELPHAATVSAAIAPIAPSPATPNRFARDER